MKMFNMSNFINIFKSEHFSPGFLLLNERLIGVLDFRHLGKSYLLVKLTDVALC